MGWGSGTDWFPYLISVSTLSVIKLWAVTTYLFIQPYEAIQRRAAKDHTTFVWTFRDFDLTTAASYATQKSAAIVFINADSGEGYITADGNQGDRYMLRVSINDARLPLVFKEQFDDMAWGRPISLDRCGAKQQYHRCPS